MRDTFQDPAVQRRFAADGYVVVPLLAPVAVDRLRQAWDARPGPAVGAGFYQDTFSGDVAHKQRVQELLDPVLLPAAGAWLRDHDKIVSTFVVLGGDSGGAEAHRDVSIVDEDRYRSVMVWTPLTPLRERTGRLWVTPGSHRAAPRVRPHGGPVGVQAEVPDDERVHLDLDPGQAIVFDQSLLHGSEANTGERPRVVAGVALRPQEARLRLAVAADEAHADLFEVPDDAFVARPLDQLAGTGSARPLGRVALHGAA